jgi:trigger factor
VQVTVEDLSAVEKKLAVEVPWDQVKSKMDEAYRELGREVALKGFRKGKAPRGLLEQLFGKRLERELARQIVEETFPQAASEKGLHPIGEPVVDDDGVKSGASFHYRARVEVAPEVVPRDYWGLQLARRVPVVTDAMVERELERRRLELTEFRKIEGRAELREGDVVLCDVMGKLGGAPFAADNQLVELASSGAAPPWPLVGRALVGRSLAEKEYDVRFTLPADYPDAELRGKSASLLLTLRDAREKLAPELDDEFAKDTGEADTLDELRKILRERIERALRADAERDLHAALRRELVQKNPFEVAPTLVERHLEDMVRRARAHLTSQGIDPDTADLDDVKLREQMRPAAADNVRATLLFEAIARKEGVEALDADLERRVAEMAVARNLNAARLKAELEKDGRIAMLRQLLREEKTLDLLLSKATITEESGEQSSR